MSLIYKIAGIIEECRKEYEEILSFYKEEYKVDSNFKVSEIFENVGNNEVDVEDKGMNILAYSDNLEFMKHLLFRAGMQGKIKLIYLDPPFFSKADYNMQVKIYADCFEKVTNIKQGVYSDTWNGGIEAYLKMLGVRLFLMKDLLAEEGCIWMHIDWHVSHYVKILMDEVFGIDNFVNEVIWNYKSGGSGSKRFARKHDTLLFYGKSKNYFFKAQKEKSYNRGYKPYRFKGVEEFEDDLGWYTLVNMKDVWQMDMVGRTSSERTGYATQKPEALIERILTSCSKEGDLCADFFGGSGTLAVTASKMGRNWITSDIGKSAVAGMKKRLIKDGVEFGVLNEKSNLVQSSDDKAMLKILCEKTSKNGCCVTLKGYNIGEDTLKNLSVEECEKIHIIIKNDSLSLIDYWSIDFNYDGSIHKPQSTIVREKFLLKDNEEGISDTGLISVFCVDVFGNVLQKLLKCK